MSTGTPFGREGPRLGHDPDGPNDWPAALPAIAGCLVLLALFGLAVWWMA